MSRLRSLRLLTVAIVACCSLTGAASAGAAAWQGPLQISDGTVSVGGDTAHIALGASGDAAAGWWDDASGGRIMLARKRAGTAWSAPVPAVTGNNNVPVLVGVDAAGDVTAAYNAVGPTTEIVTWPAGAATPTLTPLNSALVAVQDLAVNG